MHSNVAYMQLSYRRSGGICSASHEKSVVRCGCEVENLELSAQATEESSPKQAKRDPPIPLQVFPLRARVLIPISLKDHSCSMGVVTRSIDISEIYGRVAQTRLRHKHKVGLVLWLAALEGLKQTDRLARRSCSRTLGYSPSVLKTWKPRESMSAGVSPTSAGDKMFALSQRK
jgi:hypothetical protein